MFADDCTLVISEKDTSKLENKIIKVVKLTQHWLKCNNLSVNQTKSFLMYIRTSHLTRNLWNLNLENSACKYIKTTESMKFLGVFVDCHLNWNIHINELSLNLKKYF